MPNEGKKRYKETALSFCAELCRDIRLLLVHYIDIRYRRMHRPMTDGWVQQKTPMTQAKALDSIVYHGHAINER